MVHRYKLSKAAFVERMRMKLSILRTPCPQSLLRAIDTSLDCADFKFIVEILEHYKDDVPKQASIIDEYLRPIKDHLTWLVDSRDHVFIDCDYKFINQSI